MKNIRLSAILERSLFSVVFAAALLFGAGERAWAQFNETQWGEPYHLSVKREESLATVEPAAVSDVALSSLRPQEAAPSPQPTPEGATSATGAAETPACSTPTTTTRSAALPVVFVPGTAGSELRLTSSHLKLEDVLYWIGVNTLSKNNLGRAPLDEYGQDREGNRVTAPRPLSVFFIPNKLKEKLSKRGTSLLEEEIYSDFLLWAQAVFKGGFYEVPYDWRKGASKDSASRITAVVNEALCKSGQPKVILLAHSLGGIVARDYIQRTEGKSVDAFIAVGTPWLGAPKTVRALLWGYNFGAGKVFPLKKHVSVEGDAEDFAGNQYCKPNKDKPGYLCPYPVRLSFFKLKEASALARNFPAVYQQLPTHEFMEKYGTFYGQNFRPVILGMKTWEEMEDFYKSKDTRKRGNPHLYAEAQGLRERILNKESYRVSNYLIAGVYSPKCRQPNKENEKVCSLDNVMDMQMAERKKIKRNFMLKLGSLGLKALNLIVRPLGYILTREKFVLEEDRYVATDSDVDWGDGTAPLLSATAGEYLKGVGDHRFPGAASALLGEGTEVVKPVTLDPLFPHSAMLNDPKVRENLLQIYRKHNGTPGLDPEPGKPDEIVTSLKIEFFLKTTQTPGTHSIELSFKDGAQEPQRALINGNSAAITFARPRVRDARVFIPNVRHDERPLGVPRSLRITDCTGVVLELKKIRGGKLEFNGYRMTVNGKVVSTSDQSFTLKTEPLPIELHQCQ